MSDDHVEGTYGQYTGPSAGATPANDSDLHTGQNPYSGGSPASDQSGSSTYRPGRLGGADNPRVGDVVAQSPYDVAVPYYANPVAMGGNPYAESSAPTKSESGDQTAAASIAGGLATLYDDLPRNRQLPGASDAAYQHAYAQDIGSGFDQETPASERR